ncbi:MAG: single-stranded DNA-binding protein [Bacteroides sp.]|nr:single-stranded DNA-binding protein [Bacteroides sp.]
MAQIFILGRVEDDLTVKTSQSKSAYVCFRLTEQVGKGRTQSYQVWAWNEDVSRLDRLGVKKGAMLWLTGTMELVDCTTGRGKAKAILLKVYLTNFGFVSGHHSGNHHTAIPNDPETAAASSPPEILDGSREPLPE